MMMHKKGLQLLYRLYNLISSNMCLQSPYGILEYSTLHSSQERGFWRETKQGTTLCCKQVKVIISLDSVRLSQSPKLLKFELNSPQILRGASSSSRIGWLRKSSLDLRHRPLISVSVNWTFLPGRDPRTETKPGFNRIFLVNWNKQIYGHFSGGAHRIWMKHGIASQWIMNTLSAGTSMKWGQTLWTGYTSYNGDN